MKKNYSPREGILGIRGLGGSRPELKATRSFCSLGLSTRWSRQLCVAVGWSTETQTVSLDAKVKEKAKGWLAGSVLTLLKQK